MEDEVNTHSWSAKLRDENTVFQAELLALKEAIHIISHLPIKILTDNKASIQASSNPKTHNATARQFFKTILEYPQIELQCIKTHAGYLGNETADQLAKEAEESDMSPLIIKLPQCHLKNVLRAMMMNAWQKNWDEGKTGRKVHDILPKVSLSPSNWGAAEVLFFTGHGPFQYYPKRFHLYHTSNCICGQESTPIQCATDCILTTSWHMIKLVHILIKNGTEA
ncbi:hypothetical protein AVEN_25490-1 [Araneus ventricosus]|uniref:RNase H type-1 domain-containing protein n=1 Tax=Araneus ventricosus TaxID=182803 RepID=A0A4Y2CTP3_ARAVE|nr:hypothetical protein AVEN_25490-1 [Araneus ventricosus]